MRVSIKTPSRIHITLIDLNASIGRMDGGIGLALDEPSIELEAVKSDKISVDGPLADRAKDAAEKTLHGLGLTGGVKLKIKRGFAKHVGLGSGTQTALATAKAICELNDRDTTPLEMARLVGRGGTSGIGIEAFTSGGFILDGGHSTGQKSGFLPSSASKAPPPPTLVNYKFPDWKVVLVIPKVDMDIHGREEVNIFKTYCPLPIEGVRKLSHLILMKILPSIVERDIVGFGDGISSIQKVGFKKIEVGLQTPEVKELMKTCSEHSPAVGLSSFGPVIYCITEDESDLLGALVGENIDIVLTKANNRGAISRKL